MPAFAACVAREANRAAQAIGAGNLLFQTEAPAEVVAAHRLPRPAIRVPTGPITDLVQRLPTEVPVGIHLCFADLSNTAAITPSRFNRLVAFANALARRRRTNSPTCTSPSRQGSHRRRPIPLPTERCAT